MVAIKTTIRTCDRCSFGVNRRATGKRVFALDDRYYELDLCETHLDAFDRDLGGWTRLAAEIDNPYSKSGPQQSSMFTRERAELAHSVNRRSDELRQQDEQSAFAQRRAEALAAEIEEHAFKTIPGARKWTLTRHARERMLQRNFTPAEVLMVATMPGTKMRQPWRGPDIAVHVRGDCRVVVDDRCHQIITVIDRSAVLETGPMPVSATN